MVQAAALPLPAHVRTAVPPTPWLLSDPLRCSGHRGALPRLPVTAPRCALLAAAGAGGMSTAGAAVGSRARQGRRACCGQTTGQHEERPGSRQHEERRGSPALSNPSSVLLPPPSVVMKRCT